MGAGVACTSSGDLLLAIDCHLHNLVTEYHSNESWHLSVLREKQGRPRKTSRLERLAAGALSGCFGVSTVRTGVSLRMPRMRDEEPARQHDAGARASSSMSSGSGALVTRGDVRRWDPAATPAHDGFGGQRASRVGELR